MRSRRFLALYVCLVGIVVFAVGAAAQVQVELKLSRRLYILYEPIFATVTITNNSGQDLHLEEDAGRQWFGFEVNTADGRLLIPFEPDYKISPLVLRAGDRVTRKLDLTPLFPIRDFGQHRLRATILARDFNRFFSSSYQAFDLTEGRTVMRQTIGKPGTGELREYQLLTHALPDRLLLYVRVRDPQGALVYGTRPIGRLLPSTVEPQTMLDRQNNLHILHMAAPRAYFYTQVTPDGERVAQEVFTERTGSRPTLARLGDGRVEVRGGRLQTPAETDPALLQDGIPALSERPPGVPKAR